MKFLVLYDAKKAKDIALLSQMNSNFIIIENKIFWKTRYKRLLKKVDYIIAYKSSFLNSENVKWEIMKLSKNHVLFVINDIDSNTMTTKAKCIYIDNKSDIVSEIVRQKALEEGIEWLFTSNQCKDMQKEFMFKMLETSESLINRRQATNNFMLTANGVLVTLIGVLLGIENIRSEKAALILIPLIGVFICISWFSLLTSYGKLNKAKFEVISYLENIIGIPIFSAEWKYLSRRVISYKSFTKTERILPVLFIVLYIVIGVIIIFIKLESHNEGDSLWHSIYL